MPNLTAYLAPDGFEKELETELDRKKIKLKLQIGALFLTEGHAQELTWVQQVWQSCEITSISSIGDAAKKLKTKGGFWLPYSHDFFRRTVLISEQIPLLKIKPLNFLDKISNPYCGSYCLLKEDSLFFSTRVSPAFPNGKIQFIESKKAPSRAYLKLWELFSIYGVTPKSSDLCLDLGSSPGGWTWALAAMLNCQVISVDKAPLDPSLSVVKGIRYLKKDAFALKPEEIGPIDWLFSDVICDPDRLYTLVEQWRNSNLVKNFVCTLKFQGDTDFVTLEKFLAIPGSKAVHLSHNKHEVTWYLRST